MIATTKSWIRVVRSQSASITSSIALTRFTITCTWQQPKQSSDVRSSTITANISINTSSDANSSQYLPAPAATNITLETTVDAIPNISDDTKSNVNVLQLNPDSNSLPFQKDRSCQQFSQSSSSSSIFLQQL